MPITYKYIKALTPIRLFNGALWMEEEDISKLPETKFTLPEVQDAILRNQLVEVNPNDLPQDVVSPEWKLRGDWDASGNTLPAFRRIGDTYKIIGAGTVNGIPLEVGMRVLFNSLNTFEVLGAGGGTTIAVPEVSWVHQTAAVNATSGAGYLLDYSEGVFDVTMPVNPVDGFTSHFWHIEGNVENIAPLDPKPRIMLNGKSILGVAGDMTINLNFQKFSLRYSTEIGEYLIDRYVSSANDFGLVGLIGPAGATGSTGGQGGPGDPGPAGNPSIIKGYVADYAALLLITGQVAGHCYIVQDTGHIWCWDGAVWNDGGKIVGNDGTGTVGSPGAVANLQGSVSTYTDLAALTPNVADAWIVQDEGNLYIWDGLVWNNVGEIVGPQGLPGPFTKIIGSVPNAASLPVSGANGDTYIAQDTGLGHQWYDAQWNNIGQIKGSKGDDGDVGPAGSSVRILAPVANYAALPVSPTIGDCHVTSNDGHIWCWDGSVWNDGGKIVGEKGDDGVGSQGPKGDQGIPGPTNYFVKELTLSTPGYTENATEAFYVLSRSDKDALLLFNTTRTCYVVLPKGTDMAAVIPAEVDSNTRTDWPEGTKVYSRNKQTGQIRLVVEGGSTDTIIGGFISVDPQDLSHFYLEDVLTSSVWVGAINLRNELAPVIDENNPLTNFTNDTGDRVNILLDEAVTGPFNAADWTLLSNGQEITTTAMTITGGGRLVELSAAPLFDGQQLDLYYTGTSLTGVSTGNPVQPFSTMVENNSTLIDSSPFFIVSAEVMPSGTETRVLLSKEPSLSVADTAPNRLLGWSMVADGRDVGVSSIAFNGRQVIITHSQIYVPLLSSITYVSYTKYEEVVAETGGFVVYPAAGDTLQTHNNLQAVNSSVAPWSPVDLGERLVDYGLTEAVDFSPGPESNIRSNLASTIGAGNYTGVNNYISAGLPTRTNKAFTITSHIITVTDPGHGLVSGDSINVLSTSPVIAGTSPYGRWVNVIDPDTFSFERITSSVISDTAGTLSYEQVIEQAPAIGATVRWVRGRLKNLAFYSTAPLTGGTYYDRPYTRAANSLKPTVAFAGLVTNSLGSLFSSTTPILLGTSGYLYSVASNDFGYPSFLGLSNYDRGSNPAASGSGLSSIYFTPGNAWSVYVRGQSPSVPVSATSAGFKAMWLYTEGVNTGFELKVLQPTNTISGGTVAMTEAGGGGYTHLRMTSNVSSSPGDIRRWIAVNGSTTSVERERILTWLGQAPRTAS